MRVFKHGDYVEFWNACEVAAAAPWPIAVWDSRTGSVLALSDEAERLLGCDCALSCCAVKPGTGVSALFSRLGSENQVRTEATFRLAHGVRRKTTVTLVFPLSPGARPVFSDILPLLLCDEPQALPFMDALSVRLLTPEQPHPILWASDTLKPESAAELLKEYAGQVYVKGADRRVIASTPEFNAYLSNSRKAEAQGLDMAKLNAPHVRAIGVDLDLAAMGTGRTGAYALANRRVHEMLHTWRKIHRLPILAPSGDVIGLLLVLRELSGTDLTRAELKRFKSMFGVVHGATYDLPFIQFVWRDNQTDFIDYISKNILKLGVSSYEIQNLTQLARLVHPDDRPLFIDSRNSLSSRPGEISYRLSLPDGRDIRVRERVTCCAGGVRHYNWLVSRLYIDDDCARSLADSAPDAPLLEELQKRQIFINQMHMDFNRATDMKASILAALNHVCEDMGLDAGLLFEEREGRVALAYQYEGCRMPPHVQWPAPTRQDLEEAARIKRHDDFLMTGTEDLPEFCRTLKTISGAEHLHVAAIRDENTTFGMLCFMDFRSSQPWTSREHEALAQYANTLAGFVCRRRSQEMLMRLAYVDTSLGIPNRAALEKDILSADNAPQGILVIVELRNMSMIANSCGLSYGNAFLAEVCDFACQYFPEAPIYRISHNQFALLLAGWREDDVKRGMVGFFKRFSSPWNVLDKQVFGMAAAGIAPLPVYPDPEESLRQADVALSGAEGLSFSLYDSRKTVGLHQVEVLAELHGEASRDFVNMRVHYQPIYNLRRGCFCSAEALLRWMHPKHGLIPPDAFIDLAEQSGLIVPLTYHVIRESLKQIRRWREQGTKMVSINVNASHRFLRDPGVVEQIAELLREYGLEQGALTLELTESMAIQDAEATTEILRSLRAHGVKVAFDDFGVGYSSLSVLRNIPLDVVKLDKSFLKVSDEYDRLIIGFAVDAARLQGMEVCSEGVETAEHWATAASLGVTLLQGYFISRPAPPEQIEPLLRDPDGFLSRMGIKNEAV